MDTIFIEDLRLKTLVGVYPRERSVPQTVALDLEIDHAPPTGKSLRDDLRATIDYAAVVECVRSELAKGQYNLLETLAEAIAALILEKFPALRVRVRLAKPGIIKGAAKVGIAIERTAESPPAVE